MASAHPSDRLQPLSAWRCPPMTGVLTDIDDTLTSDGAIAPEALSALAALRAAGVHVIAITGRPVGWSEPFATQWPVDAIVAENGAVALVPTGSGSTSKFGQNGLQTNPDKRGPLSKIYQQEASVRATNHTRMHAVLEQIEREVPGARRATDSAGRETDIAIDHSEFIHLPQPAIDQALARMRAAGMNATVSSIHINGWFGTHNKLDGARWIVRELFGRDLDAEWDRWVYVGDSTNDQIMFEHVPHSVGVANIARFVPQLVHLPRYVTPSERGQGFAELAAAVLAGRTPRP